MKTITITGHSDDIVNVAGNAPGCDEYGVGDGGVSHVVIHSDGVAFDVFRVSYGEQKGPTWFVEHLRKSGCVRFDVKRCDHEADEPDPYTDTATVYGPIVSVECWGSWPVKDSEIVERWEAMRDDLSDEEAVAAYRAVRALRKPA